MYSPSPTRSCSRRCMAVYSVHNIGPQLISLNGCILSVGKLIVNNVFYLNVYIMYIVICRNMYVVIIYPLHSEYNFSINVFVFFVDLKWSYTLCLLLLPQHWFAPPRQRTTSDAVGRYFEFFIQPLQRYNIM